MLIDLNTVPESILSEIPLSIRLNTNGLIDTDNLPVEIIYKLRNIEERPVFNNTVEPSTVDITPEFNTYSDFTNLNSKREAIKEYIKNFLLTDKGAYPFDPTFGTNLKRYIHQLNTPTIKTLLHNELINIVNSISLSFDTPVKLKHIIFEEVPGNQYSAYTMKLFLFIENTDYTLDVTREVV